MPATSPRVTVTLPPEVAELLRETAAAAKASQSSIVSEIVVAYVPILQRVRDTLLYLKEGKEEDKKQWISDFEKAQTVVEDLVVQAQGQLDLLFPPPKPEAGEAFAPASPPASGGEARAKRPPPSNRGVKPGSSPRKGAKQG